MSLRIVPRNTNEAPPGAPDDHDEWGTRIAKLIPAEALGLYGSAVALIPAPSAPQADPGARQAGLWVIVAVCCLIAVIVRYRATRHSKTGKPQTIAIAIALVSFVLWLTALGAPTSPIALPASWSFAGPLAALLWGTIVPYFYTGDSPNNGG